MSDLTVDLSIPFPSEREADVAYQTLRVDAEPSRSGVKKTLTLESNTLKVNFAGSEARKIRVGLTSFFEALLLITETMKEFGPPEPKYDHY
ncbi:L antigen family, member 3 isoform 1 [Nasonia vitripennis]|uniref:L antigen family member 3 n=1 Tax=Nasonia vitripennis TaxID=7425 RepID=A0A7M6UFC9_NASVI|nr:L antigen family, member 3 isoform 1 [Nasonia vitripennis]